MISRRLAVIGAFAFILSIAKVDASTNDRKVRIDLYVMSLCPFGVQAENLIIPAVKSLAGHVDLKIHFIAGEIASSTQTAGQPPAFQSLHGKAEVEENMRQLCARQYFPKKYLDYILERNKDYKGPGWRDAARLAGLDADKIESCASGEEGAALLRENIKAHVEQNAYSSPIIYIDGKKYTGVRGQRSLTIATCEALKEKGVSLPQGCKKAEAMPPDPVPGGPAADTCGEKGPPFVIRVVADNACPICTPTLLEPLKKLHPNAVITLLDMTSQEGQALIKEHKASRLPLYVLDNNVQNDPNFLTLIDSFYTKSGDAYIVRPGSNTFIPSVQLNRERRPNHADIFIEATSPESSQAEAEFVDFLQQTTKKDLTFSFHYIVNESVNTANESRKIPASSGKLRAATGKELSSTLPGPIVSRLGDNNVRESLRQICLFQKAPIGAFFSYLACRSQNPEDSALSDKCLVLDDALQSCIDGSEGEKLLRQDARLVRELGIMSGVYFLWENRFGPFDWNEVDWREIIGN